MNMLQKELLNMLEVYIDVCENLGLTYYLANGSVLGAEKYGGFIPWDDDIDVAMPREDYETFLLKAKEYLPTHLFLQNYKTDAKFPQIYSKIRNSATTFIEKEVQHLPINHGIYIDIFPLDNYPEGKIRRLILKCKWKILSWMQFCGFKENNRLHHRLFRLLGCHNRTHKTISHLEKIAKNFENSNCFCDYGDRQKKGCLPKEIYGKGKKAKFEHIQVNLPEKTNEYLKYKYGKWEKDLPENVQKSHHGVAKLDLQTPYTEYLDNKDMITALADNI